MDIVTSFGKIVLSGQNETAWIITTKVVGVDTGLEEVHFTLDTDSPAILPELTLSWDISLGDASYVWNSSSCGGIYPDWAGTAFTSSLTTSMPLVSYLAASGENRLTISFSDVMRPVELKGGIREEDVHLVFNLNLFRAPEAACKNFSGVLRLDFRRLSYVETIGSAVEWLTSIAGITPSRVPSAAWSPLYSSWYNFHQNVFDTDLETECRLAVEYGMHTLIVDDGWQTDDTSRGYAFCGDWQLSHKRFPNMRKHVAKIHDLGMKYILWFSVPFVGYKSSNFEQFKWKFLADIPCLQASVLDPRFPEVRYFLINTYKKAVIDWDVDGLKLDFIDNFKTLKEDPAIGENYAGRDVKTIHEAVDKLLTDTMTELKSVKPDILIEFRQTYIGPGIRKFGNMLRAGDCPANHYQNRKSTVNLRLTSGQTAVHSDMLEWDTATEPETAALQIIAVIFSVPQISVKLVNLPVSHCEMLKFWLDFCVKNRDALLHGKFNPMYPELGYPLIYASNSNKVIAAVYCSDLTVNMPELGGRTAIIVNGTTARDITVNIKNKVMTKSFDTRGRLINAEMHLPSLCNISIPPSGLIELHPAT